MIAKLNSIYQAHARGENVAPMWEEVSNRELARMIEILRAKIAAGKGGA